MPAKPPSSKLRALLRQRITARVADLRLTQSDAAEAMGLSRAQMARLTAGEDIFSLDRLVDAASAIDLSVRMTATRPYRETED